MAKKTQNGSAETVDAAAFDGTERFRDGFAALTKNIDTAATFGRENFEAAIAAATAATKGIEQLNAESVAFAKQSVEEGMAAFKAITGAKSVNEAFEAQSEYAKSAFDAYVGHFAKFNDLMMAAAKDAFEPINGRVTAVVEVVQNARAV